MPEAAGGLRVGFAGTPDFAACALQALVEAGATLPLVLINPEITWRSDEMMVVEEGCLSVPAIYDKVERHARVNVKALGRGGQPFDLQAEDLLAVCVQHEMDHLMGKVFVEYLSLLKRNRIRDKLLKREREARRSA